MRGLELNLASRPFRNNTLIWVGYAILCAAAVGFSYWNVSKFQYYDVQLAGIDQDEGNLKQQNHDLIGRHTTFDSQIRGYDIKGINRRTTKANEVIQWRSFSWTRLFNRLEEVLPHQVRMTSVRPIWRDRDRGQRDNNEHAVSVSVEGVGRDWDAIFGIQSNLIESEYFGAVDPKYFEREDNGEFRFSIRFTYNADETTHLLEQEAAPPPDVEATSGPVAEQAGGDDAGDSTEASGQPTLPPVATEPSEVSDEWAAQTADEAAETADRKTDRKTEAPARSGPKRRALPKVAPSTDKSDNGGDEK